MNLSLTVKYFSFELLRPLKTSQGILKKKEGWLINLKSQSGKEGWGEVSPISQTDLKACRQIIQNLGKDLNRDKLEQQLSSFPKALGFGLGAALAEIDSLINFESFNDLPNSLQSAFLLPSDESIISALKSQIEYFTTNSIKPTFKWKVAILPNDIEKQLLDKILNLLPENSHLRIDANGGWGHEQANDWANYLINEKKLEWIEQPLATDDIEGLTRLSKLIPIALDESLRAKPELRKSWKSWQIRKPLLEGDPRLLLKELQEGVGFRVISTSFETGIGKRWLQHLAILQQQGPTPALPGLALDWCPKNQLFSHNPQLVWEAA